MDASGTERAPGLPDLPGGAAGLRAAGRLLLESGRELELSVEGDSMSPALPPRARVRVARAQRALRRGDVVTFVAHDRLVTHRVVSVGRGGAERGYLVTQGDNRYLPEVIPAGRVLGAVRDAAPEGGGYAPIPPVPQAARARHALARILGAGIASLLRLHPRLAALACAGARRVLHRPARPDAQADGSAPPPSQCSPGR